MEHLATLLFGLDVKHLMRCSEGERSAYKKAALYFVLIIAFCFLSLYYFFFLLTLNYVGAFPLAAVMSFVFFCIIRFTLLTIQLPIGETVTLKKLIVNGANMFRMVLFMLLVFTLIIPVSAFVFRNAISADLVTYKDTVYNEFKASKDLMEKQQLGSISSLIAEKKADQEALKTTEKNARMRKFKVQRIQRQITLLERKLTTKAQELKKQNRALLSHYRQDLKHAGMPFKRFELMFHEQNTGVVLIVLFALLFGILPAYMYVRYASSYGYGKYFGDEMVLVISAEYKQMKKDCAAYLLKHYQHSLQEESLYEDPPFNRTRVFKTPTRLTTIKLFDHFEQQP
jgi:hypothetical protein